MVDKIYSIVSAPGVQRDGTTFDSENYTDSQWCRWYRGRPKKMNGYKQIKAPSAPLHLIYGMYVAPKTPDFNVYVGDQASLKVLTINNVGQPQGSFADRTPVGFTHSPNNIWSFNRMFSTVDDGSVLIAHAAPNLAQIDNAVREPVWYGDLFTNTPLIPTGFSVSGGICILHPFLFMFGDSGQVLWTQANDPTTLLGEARVTAEKIIAMLPTRGGNSSPAGLMWSLTTVIRVTETGGTGQIDFTFDTITDDSSILSSRSVVEYDGRYYWPGIDRFLIYTGIVQELPNSMVLEYFFSNLDFTQRQKVWGTKVTKWGEIWWHFPNKNLDDSLGGYDGECNDVVIYNIREKTWYTNALKRSSGFLDPTFSYPIYSDTITPGILWKHETGLDQDIDGNLTAIPSWHETKVISWVDESPNGTVTNIDKVVDAQRFEPDFKQEGRMFFIINGREYANSKPIQSSTQVWESITTPWNQDLQPWGEWGEYVFDKTTLKIDFREQRRLLTFRFVSAVVGGDYEVGNPLVVERLGDTRP